MTTLSSIILILVTMVILENGINMIPKVLRKYFPFKRKETALEEKTTYPIDSSIEVKVLIDPTTGERVETVTRRESVWFNKQES